MWTDKFKKRVIAPTIASLLIVILFSCAGKKSDPEEEIIKSNRALSNQAIANHDTTGIASVLTDDFHMLTSRNAEVSGKHNAVRKFAEEFNLRNDVVYIRTPDKVVIFQQWNTASEAGHWVGKWTDNGEAIEVSGSYYAKWSRVGGKWLIRAEIFVVQDCSGGKYCEQAPL